MPRTVPGRKIELNGRYCGRPVVEQSEAERAEQVASEWNRTAPNRPDVDRALHQQYSGQPQPDSKPPSEPDQPARQTSGRLVKGSPEAKEHMARLRERRGKSKSTTDDTETPDNDE